MCLLLLLSDGTDSCLGAWRSFKVGFPHCKAGGLSRSHGVHQVTDRKGVGLGLLFGAALRVSWCNPPYTYVSGVTPSSAQAAGQVASSADMLASLSVLKATSWRLWRKCELHGSTSTTGTTLSRHTRGTLPQCGHSLCELHLGAT